MIHFFRHKWLMGLLLAVSLFAGYFMFNQVYSGPTANHHAELQSAWRKMQQTGEYRFSTKVEQIIHPAPSLTNVGVSSEREIYYLEGASNLSANSIEMRFYQGDGNLLNTEDALEIRVEDHHAFGRSQGSDWIALENFSMDLFAPGNDFSSFLVAAKNVTSQGVESYQLVNDSGETRNINLNHYSFDIDSTHFAAFMRDEMTTEYNRTGKLPLGMNLSLSDEYLKMLADGQIWVSEDNLPVRMDIHMKLPQSKSGEQIEAYIHTDFYEINQENLLATQPLPVKIAGFLGLNLSIEELKDFSFQTSFGFGFLMLLTVLVANARRKSIYAIISGLVIATFIFSPIWQSNQTVVFAKELQEKQASIDEQKQGAVSEKEALKELYVSDWNPQQNPLQNTENSNPATLPNLSAKDSVLSIFSPVELAQSGTTDAEEEDVDTDQDGLTDAFELEYDVTQFDPNDPDTDNDGLNDGEEYRLGLNSGNEDSDGDGIGDLDEVNYFYYRNANTPLEYSGEWYSNPTDHDTDRDGILDGTECPSRKLDQPGHASAICEDFDQDGIPNIFDTDDDNDGVPTNVDSTPYRDASTLYTNTSPLKISVDNLTEDEPVFYDFEMRPQNPEHLTYIMNVLDWPSEDNDGQIMRINDTTFHDTMDSVDLNADPRFDYGDMRLIPMLELKITGNLPLPLTNSYTAILDAENFSGELTLKSNGPGVTQITLSDAPAGTYPVYYGAGSCDDSSNIVALGDLSLGASGSAAIGLGSFADGDYSIFVFDENDEDIVACTIPYAAHGSFSDQVIDSEIINAYGGFVRNEADGSVLLYMPLSVHTDITGNSPVAFNARVPFMNEDNRFDGSRQDVRMVWMINMLTDICKPMPTDLEEDETWCDITKPEQWIPNVGRVVHTYEDSFYLTSLKITEEQGMDMNVFFEDPELDLDSDSDDPLWKLSYGLQSTFTAGREDATLGELYTRFDADVSTVPDGNEKLWGIPAKSFQVEQYHFDYADQIYKFVSQDPNNPNNLENLFKNHFEDTGVTTTILLYARQNNFRLITVGDSDQVNCTGPACHFDFASEGVLSTALVNWAPFAFTAEDGWNGYPLEDYLDMMESRLREAEDFLAVDDSADERNLIDGKIYIARFYFESMYRGVTGLRSFDNQTIANPPSELSDFDIYSDFNGLQKKGAAVGKIAGIIADAVVRGLDSNLYAWVLVKFGNKTDKVKGFFIALGDGLKQKAGKFFDLLKYKLLKVVVGVALAAVIIAVVAIAVIYFLDPSSPTGKVLGKVLTCILSTVAIIAAVMTIKEIVSLGYTLNGALQKATIIGAIVAGVITWGIFIYTWVASDVSVSSIAFTSMLADAIAATMTIILMAAIASTGVGAIIIAVVAIIDALITAVCAATGVYDREDDDIAKQYICIGISGWVTKIFKWFIYSNTFLVDYDNSDRLSFTGLGTDLQNENLGFVSTNKMAITVSLKNTITLSDIPIDWKAAAYWWQYSGSNAKTATFAYAVQPGEDNIHSDLSRGSMKNEWTATSEDDQWYVEEFVQSNGYSIDMPSPGINQDPTANLTEGSAIPVQECWVIPPVPPITFFPIPICYIRTEKNSFHMPLDGSLTLDVFPATLDEFYTLTEPSAYGFALAWDQSGDLKFPILQDADGDTLRSKHFGGNDPDDSRFDTDNDGISDKGEVSLGSSSVLFDTDDDGLDDLDELLAGTSLTRKDTDGDGLTDDLEMQGWLFTYGFEADGAPKETMVYPSPMLPDTDLDGISDLEEKIYGFNPNVRETANILDYNLEMREIDAPIVSLQLDETTAVQTFSDQSGFKFDAVCTGETCPLSGVEGRYLNAVRFDGNDVLTLPASNNQISFLNDRAFTLAAWVKPESDGTLLAKWQNSDSQHELVWGLAGGYPTLMNAQNITVTSTEAIAYNEWSHLAVSYDGVGTVRFYVNGEADSISHSWTNLVDPIAASLSPVSLGAMLSGSGTPENTYNGWLDEVQVYDHRVESVTLSEEDFIRTRIMTHRYNVQDQFVRPDEKLVLHSEVENLLNSRFAYGLLQTILDQTSAVMDWMELLIPETFVLYPKNPVVTGVNIYESDKEINLDPAYQQSVDLKIEQDASAQVVDRRTESNYAQLWLKFNETGSEIPAIDFATVGFEDSSGNMPPRKSTCTTCPGIGSLGILNNAIQFASGANTPVSLPSLNTLEILDRGYTISAWVRPEGTPNGTLTVLNSTQLAISLEAVSNGYRVDVSHNGVNIPKTSVIDRSVITNQWNHLVVRYNDGSGTLDIYINGARVATASSVPAVLVDAALTLGGAPQSRAYRVDDLRIFNRPLTSLDINRLAERPVLQLEMDTSSYADSSAYNQSITGRFLESSNLSSASVRGSSLSPLSGYNPGYLEVSGNNLLDMGDGVFTFSLWVYPEDRNTSVWQGIFGKREYGQEAHAAPTLERNRNGDLRFGFGDGSAYRSTTANSVLANNKWYHIVITFKPNISGNYEYRLYLNSVLTQSYEFSQKPQAGHSTYYIGHSSSIYRIDLGTLKVDDEHDAGSNAEPYIEEYRNGNYEHDPLGEQSMGDGDSVNVNHGDTITDYASVKYTVWEEDSTSGDDNCGSIYVDWYDLPVNNRRVSLDDGFDGWIEYTLQRTSTSFSGKIDQLEVYRYAIDSEQAFDLYTALPITLRMPLDDRPASDQFINTAVIGDIDDGDCAGSACPSAGTVGLLNQAVRFDGLDDIIDVPVATTSDYMVSLWVNTTCANCGLYTLEQTAGGVSLNQIYLRNGNVCSLSGSSEVCSRGGQIINGQWHHVVYSNNGGLINLWIDGVIVNSITGSALTAAGAGNVRLGMAVSAEEDYLSGQLDDVRVFRYSQASEVVAQLKQRAPFFLTHLDDEYVSDGILEDTPANWNLVCDMASGDCPQAGVKGRLGTAMQFDGVDDFVTLEQTVLSDTAKSFTSTIWVKPTDVFDTTQTLWTLWNRDNSNLNYSLGIQSEYL
ncbi:MAG: hypothetical protein CVU39_16395 [Chloroflexi bacterium HGW-Chloroflexi-10]|nr:MAG: hypothetical protein CVU39_16395 [Chloroflexi bacterium HGW-Chloroflexi-10]